MMFPHYVSSCFITFLIMFYDASLFILLCLVFWRIQSWPWMARLSPSLLRFHSSSCRQYPLMTSTCLLRGKRPGFELNSPVRVQTLHDWYSFFYWRNWEGFHTNFILISQWFFMVKLPGSGQCLRKECPHADAGKCWYPWCSTGHTNHQGIAALLKFR